MTWGDSTSAPDTLWLPQRIHLAAGEASGPIAAVPASSDSAFFWAVNTSRFWTRIEPDSVELWFGSEGRGIRVRAALDSTGFQGPANWLSDVDREQTPVRVVGRRVQCEPAAPAT